MQKILLNNALKNSDIWNYEIVKNGIPGGDSKVAFDKVDDTWFVIYLNERGVIKFIDMYNDFSKLLKDIDQGIIRIIY